MLCGWLLVAATLGQATQPATAAPPPAAPAAAAAQPATRPKVILLPPITLSTQPAAAAPAAPTTQPVVTARVPAPAPVVATPTPAPAAPAPAPQVTVTMPPPAPAVQAAPASQPVTAVVAAPPAVGTQPAGNSAAMSLAAAVRQTQGGSAATTQPDGTLMLPPLSGEEVAIEVMQDGSVLIRGNASDVAILQQFMRQLQKQQVPPMQVFVYELKNARATDLANNLVTFWTKSKTPPGKYAPAPEDAIAIVPEPRSNSLMIAASPQNLPEIKELINKLDTSTLQIKSHSYHLKYIKATEAATTIQTILTNRSQKLQNYAGSLYDIQADTRTNSLLISASPSDFEQIKALIELIDVEPVIDPATGSGAVKLALFPLQKAVARDLVTVLTDMLNSGTGAAAAQEQIRRLQLSVQGPRGEERKLAPLNLEKPIRITADPGTNSVIVASIETNLPPIGELIKLLDQMPLSEEVLVRIYPLQHSDAQTLLTSLRDMFQQGKTITDVPGKTAVQGRTPDNVPGAALVYNVSLSLDARTQSLIVAGRPEQLMLVEQVIKAVDVPNEANRFTPRLVRLEHTDATKLSTALLKIVDARAQALRERGGATAAQREQVLIIPEPRTNSLIVVAKDDNYQEISKLARDLDTQSAGYLGQIHIINLDKLNAADLAPKLKELWQGRKTLRREGELPDDQPTISTDSRSNSLIIASNQDDFEVIARLVKELEQQKLSPIAQIRSIRVEHNDTTKIADTIRKLFDERSKIKPKGQEDVMEDKVAVIEDPLSRTIFIASTQSNYDEILKLVSQLDVPPAVDGAIRTFYIKNADVTKAADTIREMFDKGIITSGDPKNLPVSLTKVTVVANVRSSAILVSASPQNMALVEEMLKVIDTPDMPNTLAEARFFQLQNADAVRVADMLDQLLEGMRSTSKDLADQLQAKIVPNTRTNTLAISGSRLAMRRVADLIQEIDKAAGATGSSADVQIYQLKNAPAPRIAQILTSLFEKRDAQGAKATPVAVFSDETSNTLIVTAAREQQEIVRDMLTRLDVKTPFAQLMEVIPLKSARAQELSETLTRLLQEQRQGGGGQAAPAGFAITAEERTNSIIVFAPPDMMANIRTIVDKLDTTDVKVEMALRVYSLRNQRAEDLQKLLDQFFKAAGLGDAAKARQMIVNFIPVDPATGKPRMNPETGRELLMRLVHQDVTITADPATNSLMVLAPAGSIDMMGMMIDMLDSVTPNTATIQVFTLLNADATEMKKVLDDLFSGKAASGGGSSGSTRTTLTLAEGGAAIGGAAPGGGVIDVMFAVDERTNSIIAAGSPSYLKIVERLVIQLDYKEMDERTVRVVHLRNAKAQELAETMKAYFDDESQAIEQASSNEAGTRRLQRHVTIQDSGDTSNSLLLSYSPRMESQIISMINELDQPPPQVMIQVLMAEVTLNDRFEMGMEFALQDLLYSEKATVQATPNGNILHGDNFDTVFSTDIGAAGSGQGINFTVTGEDFNFLFHALQTEGRLEVLSRPSIMVRDNQEATFNVGERVPTVRDINIGPNGQVTPSVNYEEVGVILGVTPIINPDGFVNLDIAPEISGIGTSGVTISSGITLPTFTQRKAETSVTIKDGETIIIGGLITNQENSSETKLPLAGDVPILGWAFRATTRSTNKTELLIVLTPHVIRDPTQARAISVHMRDQTGLNDNIRMSPLMQGLQVTPEKDQFGPQAPYNANEVTGSSDTSPRDDEQGPQLDEYGPSVNSAPSIQRDREADEFGPTVSRKPGLPAGR